MFVAFAGFVDRPSVTKAADVVVDDAALAPIAPLAVGPIGRAIDGSTRLYEAAEEMYRAGSFRFNDDSLRSRFAASMRYEEEQ